MLQWHFAFRYSLSYCSCFEVANRLETVVDSLHGVEGTTMSKAKLVLHLLISITKKLIGIAVLVVTFNCLTKSYKCKSKDVP